MWLYAALKIIYTEYSSTRMVWTRFCDNEGTLFLLPSQVETRLYSSAIYLLACHLNISICLYQARSQTFFWGGAKNNF